MIALVFIGYLVVLSIIDFKHQILPDALTLSLLWLGLLVNMRGTFAPLDSAVLGAVVGYGVLWTIMHVYKIITGKIGMGHGDFKLCAALGAWLGWQALPLICFLASIMGCIVAMGGMVFKNQERDSPMPFGPCLALAGVAVLLWQQIPLWE